ncbi:hypothetical protein FJ987_07085 [Mesorhizobium sp. CU2]|nr:hypothetical protein FJ988_25715 [Mesorhizobium sp. CU3]TPO18419.1 hypothetical protein FJ987_07085 [Mesorhizobium sp. CU2]
MRPFLLALATGYFIGASNAFAADKTVHDEDHGFSLTFPEGWTNEGPAGHTIWLKVKSGKDALTCRVSEGRYDPSDPDSPADPKTFIEKEWSADSWQKMVGVAYDSADFSNDRLARFPDGYPIRIADMDFHYTDSNVAFYGRSVVGISMRGTHHGLVGCDVAGDTAEDAQHRWAPLADVAEKVVGSFVLDPR